jgi:DnaJ-class molecular chaperone
MSRAGPDHYAVLGVPHEAAPEEIRRAYRGLARRLHPDVSDVPGDEPMAAANAAWYVLGDETRRAVYDRGVASSSLRDQPSTIGGAHVAGSVPRRTALMLFVAAVMCAVTFVLVVLIGFTQGPGAAT